MTTDTDPALDMSLPAMSPSRPLTAGSLRNVLTQTRCQGDLLLALPDGRRVPVAEYTIDDRGRLVLVAGRPG